MTYPTAGEIALITTAAEDTLNDTCTIQDPGTVSTTTDGGTTISGAVTYSAVPCRRTRVPVQSRIAEAGEQLSVDALYVLAVKKTQALSAGWLVTMGGETFSVKEVQTHNSIGILTKAYITRQDAIGG